MKNFRFKRKLSLLIASSLFFTHYSLGYAYTYRFGFDIENNSEYSYTTNPNNTAEYYIDKSVDPDAKTVTVHYKKNFRDSDKWELYGGRVNSTAHTNNVAGYTLILNGVKGADVTAHGAHSTYNNENNKIIVNDSDITNVYGGRANTSGNSTSNIVEITNSAVSGNIYGGYVKNNFNAVSNSVKIIGKTVGNVYGGYVDLIPGSNPSTDKKVAKNNVVALTDTEASNVYAGVGKHVTNNKVFLDSAVIGDKLAGANADAQTISGNELILLSANNQASEVSNFDVIRFGDENKLSWTKDETILTANSFLGENIELDLANITLPEDFSEENIGEKMTLLEVANAENLSNFSLQNSVFSEANSFNLSEFKTFDVDLNYTPMHSVFAENTKIIDKIKGKVNSVVFKNIPWVETSPLIAKDDNFDYENAAVNTANINFTNVDSLSKDDEMILVESFGDTTNITGDTYKIKTSLEGKGKAKIDDNKNLVFVIETAAKKDEPKIEIKEDTTEDFNDNYDEPEEEIQPKENIKKEEIKPKENAKEETKKEEIKPKEEIKEEPKGEIKEENISQNDDAENIKKDETTNVEENSNSQNSPTLKAQEQTHNTVMSMEAAMVALSSAGDFVQTAMEGIADGAKGSSDGVATYAGMGGGSSKTKTGSSVNANTWSAILALGQERKLQKGTFSYGGFFEYGRANYTMEPNNGMSGASKYTGGGFFAKWQNLHNVYIECSIRAGKTRDSASGILTDSVGNRYGYDVSSNYVGAHLGVGKIYNYENNNELDVYCKFFCTRRGGVSYEAGGFYDLDAVSSKVLKIGGRYGKNKVGWNSYVGLSYAYEFDGVASGYADGYAIREARTTGGTAACEIGLRLKPSATSKWKSDISLKAHAGRSKGIGGHISLAYLF